MFIIGIAGGTGSGKTTVVRKIMQRLPKGEVGIISQDNYYKDSSHVPAEERQNINFDEPAALPGDGRRNEGHYGGVEEQGSYVIGLIESY